MGGKAGCALCGYVCHFTKTAYCFARRNGWTHCGATTIFVFNRQFHSAKKKQCSINVSVISTTPMILKHDKPDVGVVIDTAKCSCVAMAENKERKYRGVIRPQVVRARPAKSHFACDALCVPLVANMALMLRGSTISAATIMSSECFCHHRLPNDTVSPLQYLPKQENGNQVSVR